MAVLRRTQSSETTHDLHQDHLGSTDTITDATGGIVERLSYDPHGLRRAADWQDATGTITPGYTTRGFTGHEHLDSLKLVHMNGRVYDPVIGRFLSPDPAYQNLAGSQALNRYSYVLNNPLSYTDPSGYFFKKIFKAIKRFVSSAAKKVKHAVAKVGTKIKKVLAENEIVRAAVVVGASFFIGVGALAALGVESIGAATLGELFVAGFSSGLVSGFIGSGGDLKEAALSAVTAAAFAGVGRGLALAKAPYAAQVAAHAVVGGTASELRGGKFASGAISAGVAKGLGPFAGHVAGGNQIAQTVAIAVVGGVAAEFGGGKFANGASTAAFAYLYNQLANDQGSGRKGYNVNLLEHELKGGHTIRLHVAKQLSFLFSRVRNNPNLPAASTFRSLRHATALINMTLNSNAERIREFLGQPGDGWMNIESQFNLPTGDRVTQSTRGIHEVDAVYVGLLKGPDIVTTEGFLIVTSYPQPFSGDYD